MRSGTSAGRPSVLSVEGQGQVTLLKCEETRVVFFSPDPTNATTGLFVSVVRTTYEEFSTCETALPIDHPNTALHCALDIPVQLASNGVKRNANSYSFCVAEAGCIDISTCFRKTLIDTAIGV